MTMKIIREPEVYFVGQQTVVEEELDRFLADHNVSHWETDTDVAGEVLTEVAGRICYSSYSKKRPGGNSKYLEHIKECSHGSVLEHSSFNLIFTSVSRSLVNELIRHRAGLGYSQASQRFIDESVAEYIEPDIIADDPELHQIWQESVQSSHNAYVKLAEKLTNKLQESAWLNAGGVPRQHSGGKDEFLKRMPQEQKTELRKTARQSARSVLPNATETKIFVTANARALRHFIEQRGSRHADVEIRKLANKILDVMVEKSPNLFGDYTKTLLPDGTYEITTPYRKV